jgi:hypothetical protein
LQLPVTLIADSKGNSNIFKQEPMEAVEDPEESKFTA